MAKQDISIGDLVAKIQRGDLVLPEMQRRYVWSATKVRDLLDSLYRGYPSGSILVWENQGGDPKRNLDIPQATSPLQSKLLLLDGQQRLTSLTALISGKPVVVRSRKHPIEIMFNLAHPEETENAEIEKENLEEEEDDLLEEEMGNDEIQEHLKKRTFVVYSKALEGKGTWIPVTNIFKKTDAEILRPIGINSDHEKWDKYSERLGRVRNIQRYMYVMQILGSKYDYKEVTEIFVRVNSSGVRLRGTDLAIAQITAKWPGSLKIFEGYAKEAKDFGYGLDVGHLVRSLVVFATGQSRFKTVGSISQKKLEESWEIAKKGLNFTLNFLNQNTNIESIDMLSSSFILHPIAVLSMKRDEKISKKEEKELIRWTYLAHAFGHFSGSSESHLDADINTLTKKKGTAAGLIDILKRQFGRLSFDAEDLKGRGKRSALFSMTYLAILNNGAKDWFTGLGISKHSKGKSHKIEFHHIFPNRLLEKEGYEKIERNEIANMAFIGGRTNRKISSRKPEIYLEKIVKERGEEALKSQFIPMDRKLWKLENYRYFLIARRELLIEEINKFLV